MKNKAIDPVTLEVIWNRFLSVANEQQDALIRTAFSTIVRESQDLACGLFDTKGRMIAQSLSGTPGHINAMATSMKHFLAAFPPTSSRPGDVLITNDPWQTAGQINDITITTPMFKQDDWSRCSPILVIAPISAGGYFPPKRARFSKRGCAFRS